VKRGFESSQPQTNSLVMLNLKMTISTYDDTLINFRNDSLP